MKQGNHFQRALKAPNRSDCGAAISPFPRTHFTTQLLPKGVGEYVGHSLFLVIEMNYRGTFSLLALRCTQTYFKYKGASLLWTQEPHTSPSFHCPPPSLSLHLLPLVLCTAIFDQLFVMKTVLPPSVYKGCGFAFASIGVFPGKACFMCMCSSEEPVHICLLSESVCVYHRKHLEISAWCFSAHGRGDITRCTAPPDRVLQRLALSLDREKFPGSIPGLRVCLCGIWMLSPHRCGSSPGNLASSRV